MKLTLVISSLTAGGAERVLSNLANYWDAKGHKVTIITLSAEKPFYSLSETIKLEQLDQLCEGSKNFLTRISNILMRILALRKAIRKSAPDVVLSFVDVMNVATLIACVGLSVPVVVSERIDPHFHPLPWLYKILRRWFYPLARKVVVQTKSAASYFKDLKNTVIIPNAVHQFNPVERDFALPIKNIVSVGRLCKQKNFSTLIKAFASIYNLHTDITLTIYGEGEEHTNLESLAKSLKIDTNVFLSGTVPNIQSVLANANLFVFPSHYEGFPNALCEAMAAGLPVIASNCSGNIDVIHDGVNGRLFPVGDVEKLSSLMRELISDSLQCQKLSENGIKLSDIYSPDKIYQLWDEVIEKTTSSSKIKGSI